MSGHTSSSAASTTADLESFRRTYRDALASNDPTASQRVQDILSSLNADEKEAYMREMASIRTGFHRTGESQRADRARSLLATMQPSEATLSHFATSTPLSTASTSKARIPTHEALTKVLRSRRARKYRRSELALFLDRHCRPEAPGTHPLCRSLFGVMLVQSQSRHSASGAGERRVQWTVDRAVFTDAGDDEWLEDSLHVLIEVLGFSARPEKKHQQDPFRDTPPPASSTAGTASSTQDDEEHYTLTTSDWMTNTEYRTLLSLFPPFIATPVRRDLTGTGTGARSSWIPCYALALRYLRWLASFVVDRSKDRQALRKVGHGQIALSDDQELPRCRGYEGGPVDRLLTWLSLIPLVRWLRVRLLCLCH